MSVRAFALPAPLAALAMTLGVAACSEPEPAPAPEPAPQPAPTLGGVDLTQPIRALGTEPFWGVDITATELVYSGVDRPEQRLAHGGPTIQGTVATWVAPTANPTMEVTLIDTDCSDGMSDRTYPLTARVVVDGETLNGCAALTSAIMTAGEGGDLGAG